MLVEYEGINVEQDTKLRSDFRANNVKYQVLKNRLVKRALNELGFNEFDNYLEKTQAETLDKQSNSHLGEQHYTKKFGTHCLRYLLTF